MLGPLDVGDGRAAFREARAGRLGDAEGDGRVGRARGEVGGRVRVREVAAPGRDRDDAGEARGPRGRGRERDGAALAEAAEDL